MESADGLVAKHVDFDGTGIDFGEGLHLDVVSPFPILPFGFNVLVDVFHHVVAEKSPFQRNIVHANFSDLLMVFLVTIKLVRDRAKQAITVAGALLDH